jgi:HME family heavy-metal exporter
MVSGVAQIAIKVAGDDLDTLLSTAEKDQDCNSGRARRHTARRRASSPDGGTTDPPETQCPGSIRSDRAYVGKVLQTALQGECTSQVLEGQRQLDLLIRLEEGYRTDYANLGRLRLDLPNGRGQVELSELAEISEGSGPNAVNREMPGGES